MLRLRVFMATDLLLIGRDTIAIASLFFATNEVELALDPVHPAVVFIVWMSIIGCSV